MVSLYFRYIFAEFPITGLPGKTRPKMRAPRRAPRNKTKMTSPGRRGV